MPASELPMRQMGLTPDFGPPPTGSDVIRSVGQGKVNA